MTDKKTTKDTDLAAHREQAQGQFLTTMDGVRVSTTNDTLKAGHRGPSLIQDFHFQEKLSHFDRERIPERVVHARGYGAHGVFVCTDDCSDVTSAHFLGEVGRETSIFIRFSTVAGFRGSPDNVRDVRGFAVKFYTEEGNFDLVGNDFPVFFIQDAIKFPDFVHSVKPEPDNEMPQGASAHDTFWDFISLQPEATHMVMWAMSDRGIPRSLRTIEGFGVHTFVLTTADGKASFVKFHWKPLQGLRSNIWDEHQKIAGKNSDFHRADLWDAIEAGNYPEWELGLQIVPLEDEHKFDFDLLDPTKIIPEEEVPVRIVGKMTLNRNTNDFFAETEQVALHPGRFVPGISASNDPLLQGRMFSYLDTQFYRLGGPNFDQLPINRPLSAVHTNKTGGQHQMKLHTGKASYFPNSTSAGYPQVDEQGGYVHYAMPVDGVVEARRAESFNDHYSQATLFWNSQSDAEKDHLANAMIFELSKVKSGEIHQRVVDNFNHVDNDLASRVAEGLGRAKPAPVVENHGKRSAALSIDNYAVRSLRASKIAVLALDGYDAITLKPYADAITAEGGTVVYIGKTIAGATAADGSVVPVMDTLKGSAPVFFDAVIFPGGPASQDLAKLADVRDWVTATYRHFKPLLVIGEGAGVLGNVNITANPEAGIFADAEPGAFVQALLKGRFWNRDVEMI